MLKSLKFRLNEPTPYVFMLRFLKAAQSDIKVWSKTCQIILIFFLKSYLLCFVCYFPVWTPCFLSYRAVLSWIWSSRLQALNAMRVCYIRCKMYNANKSSMDFTSCKTRTLWGISNQVCFFMGYHIGNSGLKICLTWTL